MALSAEPTPYLFACLDPDDGTCVFGPIAHGKRAREFADATDTVLVRWPVEQAIITHQPGVTKTEWLHAG